jgi:hypothetical protein
MKTAYSQASQLQDTPSSDDKGYYLWLNPHLRKDEVPWNSGVDYSDLMRELNMRSMKGGGGLAVIQREDGSLYAPFCHKDFRTGEITHGNLAIFHKEF